MCVCLYIYLYVYICRDDNYTKNNKTNRYIDRQISLLSLVFDLLVYFFQIFCLQEVQEDHYLSQIKPALQALGLFVFRDLMNFCHINRKNKQ